MEPRRLGVLRDVGERVIYDITPAAEIRVPLFFFGRRTDTRPRCAAV